MWNEMVAPQAPLLETILRTVLVYVAVVILIRLMGKRGLAEMSTFDIVVTFLLAEIVGGAAMADDNSLTGAMLGALTLVAMNIGFNYLVHRSSVASRVLQGKPVTVIRDGRMAEGALRRLRISASELDHAIRGQHGDDISEVDHAELTPSGKLVLTLKRDEQSATKADIAELTENLHQLKALVMERR
jgi:uncharacterized membrane protein YcaP (DUF421 family)